jgi:glycerol-3-phosphate acyltransferase PlsY
VLKGAAAAGLGWAVGGHTVGLLCGAAAVLGHSFPIVHRGGKGVATCAGVIAVLFPLHGLGAAVAWVVVAKATRRPSIASIVLAVGIPVAVAITGAPAVEVVLLAGIAALVVLRHAGNISRLVHGTERPIEAGQS